MSSVATNYTHTRIRKEYLDKLHELAEANKRSAMKELETLIDGVVIDGLPYELASYGDAYPDASRQATLRLRREQTK